MEEEATLTKLTTAEWLEAKAVLPTFILKRMVTLYQCTECQMAFPEKAAMLQHLKEFHTDEVPSS